MGTISVRLDDKRVELQIETKTEPTQLVTPLVSRDNILTKIYNINFSIGCADVVLEVCKNMSAWPGRHLFDDGEQRRYFGLKTEARGVVEFECKNQREHDVWTHGVSRLLSIVAERKNRH